ncbi:response regulator transcription factor [Litchfieldia salsa]|uniref:DNA-binding response regulator, OmpR family, contains REC and winged-helix (WHTH) domain n=1 Tax=Litchfieldia salsa TaxID=930152 RepID=A0A1H0WAV2_9BACI|nr:response regulator transcription factor [Litchfieldia salsa]SDP87880.1 DNA-binding response regulator, OmpR family, contains REC and winged-helix (wHTH) domain [Litchfieldia salsa]
MKKVLLVDDEIRMIDLLSLYLKPRGYHCLKASSGKAAIEILENETVNLVLLDVMMPDMDGWITCKQIREFSSVPIIMLTARDQKSDVVKGLNLGADDYITKPFDENELIARIESIFRRIKHSSIIEFKQLIWNEDIREVYFNEGRISLTPKEFTLIGLLLNNRNRVYSREQLIEKIWGFDTNTEGRTIDSHIRNIRDKLRQVDFPIDEHLLSVWGVGYKWVD